MLKSIKRGNEVVAEKVGDNLYEYRDESGVKRQFYYDDNWFIHGEMDVQNHFHDALDELGGLLPELDRTLEEGQLALERLQDERERALHDNHLALYLALETKAAQLRGYLQGMTFLREPSEDRPLELELLAAGRNRLSLDDTTDAQAKLDVLVTRIEGLLKRRAEQEDLN